MKAFAAMGLVAVHVKDRNLPALDIGNIFAAG